MIKFFCLGFLLIALSCVAETLTDIKGRSIEVEILKVNSQAVEVRRADGVRFSIPLAQLSELDRQRLNDTATKPAVTSDPSPEKNEGALYKILNQKLGIDLWGDENLWDDAPHDVAYRLGWPQESKAQSQSSFRVYFKKKSPIGGAIPYTAVLYGQNGKVDYISIMFANKGDSVTFDLLDNERKALKAVNAAIDADHAKLEASLDVLGSPDRQSTGSGKAMKERILRWDVGNSSLLLAAVEDEYLALRIMPQELADQRGRPERINTTRAKQMARANIQKNDFGDVLIHNIPMVDQGPKGYCVPATLERCLRYMGIRADMYALAMAGNTGLGGGTYVSDIIKGTSDFVRRAGRQMQNISGKASVRDVKKFIDNGQPILWTMYSTSEYNLIANAITRQRMKANDIKLWKKSLSELLKRSPKLEEDLDQAHLCLIVGYNDASGELAVSDSWGPEYELRWISEDEAQDISSGYFYVIDF